MFIYFGFYFESQQNISLIINLNKTLNFKTVVFTPDFGQNSDKRSLC